MLLLNDFPAESEIGCWQTKLGRKHVHCAHRQQTERGRSPCNSVYDFVDRSVSARCDDDFESFGCGVTRHAFRFTRARGGADRRAAGDRFDAAPPAPRAFTARRRIKNDDRVVQ